MVRLELTRHRLRTDLLGPLCIHVQNWRTVWVLIPPSELERHATSPEVERFKLVEVSGVEPAGRSCKECL